MLSYIVGFIAFLLFLYNPLVELLAPGHPKIQRTPRPQINEDLLAIQNPNETRAACPPDSYLVRVYSREPLVLYVENFLSSSEREHLLQIRLEPPCPTLECRSRVGSNPIFEPSTITHDGGDSAHRDAAVRDSEVAVVPRTDTVRCIEARARALQGWRNEVWIERLRVQRYKPQGHYDHHFDWSSNRGGWGRVSSFIAWVDDGDGQLRGGGTEFPLLRFNEDPEWCAYIDCATSSLTMQGEVESEKPKPVVFKPLPGNAVYWENFRSDGSGRGYRETWHAGLPVQSGLKIGLNIWSWGWIE